MWIHRWGQVKWTTTLNGRKVEKAIEPVSDEAERVKQVFRACLRMESVTRVKRYLDTLGIKSRNGNSFSWQALHDILTNDFYIGVVRYGDVKTQGEHEPIVSRILFGKVQATLARSRRRRNGWVNPQPQEWIKAVHQSPHVERSNRP